MDILGNNVSGSELKRIVNFYDEDGNGKISFTEFLKVIFSKNYKTFFEFKFF